MEPLQETLSLVSRTKVDDHHDAHTIYTHSVKSRYLVLTILGTYLILFTFFTDFALNKVLELQDLPTAFLNSGDFAWTRFSTYFIGGLGWLVALLILAYFLFSVVDIWGLQVWVNSKEIRVQNTISGHGFARFTGVGRMTMDEILEIRPKPMVTYLVSQTGQVRFSPVDQIEQLIATIMRHAHQAKIVD